MMLPVNSSSIRAVGYDRYHLFVQFHTSATIYTHPGVPHSLYVSFMQADSMGSFYNKYIRGKYK